jgi:bifunctional N-acetylglucosamine-1-phosphate-uridyltransferase/glucosamine-1-phosphate-acetyltransferase GlmU-like protein
MIDHLLDLYEPLVDRVVLVVAPDARESVERHMRGRLAPVHFALQDHPTGMLDAILAAQGGVLETSPAEVWVTWCDQVAVSWETVDELARRIATGRAAFVFPTHTGPAPYIHFDRDAEGRLVGVRQRREGDDMPEAGESDIGLFAMTGRTYLQSLPDFARGAGASRRTGERNFLPFIPWLAASETVETFPCREAIEAVGVNTPEDLAAVAAHLRSRAAARRKAELA